VAELRQLDDEFDHVEIQPRQRRIVAHTDAITLEDVALGPFSIELSLDGLVNRLDSAAFEVLADEPNPAGGDDGGHPHPHVSGGSLCAGDATVPIASALAQGRICDAFVLVSAVLHTYNPASAYVALSEWDGGRVTCSDCGRRCSGDDACFCDGCGGDYCESCISNCARCDRTRCLSCLPQDDDDDDDERLCQHCRRTCRACGTTADAARLRRQDGLCDACAADDEDDEEEVEHGSDQEPAKPSAALSPPAITGSAVDAVAPDSTPLPTESFA
jgi:hypothetical protein